MKIGYIRVSTQEQNEARQIAALEKAGVEKMFIEKVSGKDIEHRAQLLAMLDFSRQGDTIIISDFSRLARSTADLLEIVERMNAKGVDVVSLKESFNTGTPQGRLMLTMLAAIYQFERESILERQREGIALAKQRGVYKGRKPVEIESSRFEEVYSLYKSREITKTEMAKRLSVSRPTLDKMLKEYEEATKKAC